MEQGTSPLFHTFGFVVQKSVIINYQLQNN